MDLAVAHESELVTLGKPSSPSHMLHPFFFRVWVQASDRAGSGLLVVSQVLQSLQGALYGAAASSAANGKRDRKKKSKKVSCLPARGSPPKQFHSSMTNKFEQPWLSRRVLQHLDRFLETLAAVIYRLYTRDSRQESRADLVLLPVVALTKASSAAESNLIHICRTSALQTWSRRRRRSHSRLTSMQNRPPRGRARRRRRGPQMLPPLPLLPSASRRRGSLLSQRLQGRLQKRSLQKTATSWILRRLGRQVWTVRQMERPPSSYLEVRIFVAYYCGCVEQRYAQHLTICLSSTHGVNTHR